MEVVNRDYPNAPIVRVAGCDARAVIVHAPTQRRHTLHVVYIVHSVNLYPNKAHESKKEDLIYQ